jgi:hypothetical protein
VWLVLREWSTISRLAKERESPASGMQAEACMENLYEKTRENWLMEFKILKGFFSAGYLKRAVLSSSTVRNFQLLEQSRRWSTTQLRTHHSLTSASSTFHRQNTDFGFAFGKITILNKVLDFPFSKATNFAGKGDAIPPGCLS